ncbi:MAG: hypothetical protein KDC83_07360 [Flavobacteriales bacterium]|nr:hypothetical protein [Flavobacteriales bacterium]
MSWKYGVLIFLFGFGLAPKLNAQLTTDSQLAAHYYQSEEYDKASLYYKRLYDNDQSYFNYSYYLKCLEKLQDYDEGKKLIKKHQKIEGQNPRVRVDYGRFLKLEGESSKSNKEFEKLIKDVPKNYGAIKELAEAFMAISEDGFALETYEKGQDVFKGTFAFNLEIASLLSKKGRYDEMVDQILELLDNNPGYLKTVQASLSKNGSFEENSKQNQALKSKLIKRVNQQPDKIIYSEMLIWMYMQESNWNMALIQTKALDRRLKEEGARVYGLAEILLNNKKYDLASDACSYVVQQGKLSPYYIPSRILALQARHQKITQGFDFTEEDIDKLMADYDATLIEIGRNSSTASLIRQKAFIQAFYQHELDSALNTYEFLIDLPGLDPAFQSESRLEYGDALLMAGYIWDASLEYGIVDKKFKYDRLGEQAKLKSAKINFYTGNFKLAKAQLDVLKGSTSKLIANDAMLLSVLITDNSTVDTSTVPLQLYADADLLVFQNRTDEALLKLDSINDNFRGHALEDEILMLKYEMAAKVRDWEAAATSLQTIIDRYIYDILADKAIFLLAELKEIRFDDKEGAMRLYEIILLDFKDSLYATEARKRFRNLRGDNIN